MRNAVICSTGAYAPPHVYNNQYFNALLGEDVGTWLEENVEIFERRWAGPEESTADLCLHAAREALDSANISADQLDLIIIATDTPEYVSPSTASVVQHRLGASNAGTFDVNTACAGFVTALDIGAKYIRADDQYKYVLVIGAYMMSKYLNKTDKKTVTLFADGAGAVLLEAVPDSVGRGFLASKLISQGQFHDWMGIYGGGTHMPITQEVVQKKEHLLKFVHKFPKELNPEMWSAMALDLCRRLEVTPSDIQHFFITQININSIRETMDRLHQPHDKAHTVMHHYGYTGSACIPMAFHDALSKGRVQKNDLIVFIGSGGGLAFASAAFRF
jgi:3-oxoacyl-[acyl-carrier-protein] synthase-3